MGRAVSWQLAAGTAHGGLQAHSKESRVRVKRVEGGEGGPKSLPRVSRQTMLPREGPVQA